MTDTKPKKLHNRFDEWQAISVFSQTTSEYLSKTYTELNHKFYIKCVLGVLLAVNAYLSHFGPWTWPGNFHFLIFSVLFYHIGSTVFDKLGGIKVGTGSRVGEYIVDGIKKQYLYKLTPDRVEYVLEEYEAGAKEAKRKKTFNYLEYFTEQGDFLQQKYLKHLQGFMNNRKK